MDCISDSFFSFDSQSSEKMWVLVSPFQSENGNNKKEVEVEGEAIFTLKVPKTQTWEKNAEISNFE